MSVNVPFLVLAGLIVIVGATVLVAWLASLNTRREKLDRAILLTIWTVQQHTGEALPGYVVVRAIQRHHWATCWRMQQLTGRLIERGTTVMVPANFEPNQRLPVSAQYWGYRLTHEGYSALTKSESNTFFGGVPTKLPGWPK